MKKLMNLLAVPMLALSVIAMTSCEKIVDDATETADSGEDFAEDQTAISGMFDVAQDVAETQGFMMKNGNSILPENVTIDYKDTVYTDGDGIEIELDLGQGTVCNDGWTRSGKYVILTNEKRFSEVGAKVWLKIPSGVASMYKDGTEDVFTITMMSADKILVERTATDQFNIEYTFGLSYEKAGVEVVNYFASGNYTVTQTAGASVPGAADDEFVLTGTAGGANHNGTEYTMTITEDMVRKVDKTCSETFIKGKMEIRNEGSKTALKLEFGDGTCDNDVTIILPGGIQQKYTVK